MPSKCGISRELDCNCSQARQGEYFPWLTQDVVGAPGVNSRAAAQIAPGGGNGGHAGGTAGFDVAQVVANVNAGSRIDSRPFAGEKQGVRRGLGEAARCYEESAKRDFLGAKAELGALLASGWPGRAPAPAEARRWLERALVDRQTDPEDPKARSRSYTRLVRIALEQPEVITPAEVDHLGANLVDLHAEALLARADLRLALHRPEEALVDLRAARSDLTHGGTAYRDLLRLLAGRGLADEAAAVRRELEDMAPGSVAHGVTLANLLVEEARGTPLHGPPSAPRGAPGGPPRALLQPGVPPTVKARARLVRAAELLEGAARGTPRHAWLTRDARRELLRLQLRRRAAGEGDDEALARARALVVEEEGERAAREVEGEER